MTETDNQPDGRSAGALIKAAREKQGLHVAALAAALKVSPRKLEALEADRLDELPSPVFVRALAQAVCRALKIDDQPVLALLPRPADVALEHVVGNLNTPFRDRTGGEERARVRSGVRPLVLASVLLVAAALALWLLPLPLRDVLPGMSGSASAPLFPPADRAAEPEAVQRPPAAAAPAPRVAERPAPAVSARVPAPSAQPTTPAAATGSAAVPSAPASRPAAPAAAAVRPGAAATLRLSATGTSWVEVQDARGEVLFSRTLQSGESATVDAAGPLRVVVGNAEATTVAWRGRPVDVAAAARSNVARLELP
jgi:cytoskeleton protein RodZ